LAYARLGEGFDRTAWFGRVALFLVFGALSRIKKDKERRWLGPLAMVMAVLALTGGLTLAYLKRSPQSGPQTNSAPAAQPAPKTQTNMVGQTTSGAGSPAVQGVQGDVTITVDQSSTRSCQSGRIQAS
jgi:hypothetical protein